MTSPPEPPRAKAKRERRNRAVDVDAGRLSDRLGRHRNDRDRAPPSHRRGVAHEAVLCTGAQAVVQRGECRRAVLLGDVVGERAFGCSFVTEQQERVAQPRPDIAERDARPRCLDRRRAVGRQAHRDLGAEHE